MKRPNPGHFIVLFILKVVTLNEITIALGNVETSTLDELLMRFRSNRLEMMRKSTS